MESAVAYQRTFNRYELKYLVREARIRTLVEALAPYTDTDPHAHHEHGYVTHTVYCDSPDLTFFWEKVDGQKHRRKLRFRRYEGQSDVFVEIKQRIAHTVQKRRVRWPLERVRTLFYEGAAHTATPEETSDAAGAEALLLWHRLNFRPTMGIWYRRLPLRGTHDPGLRITFDTGLSYAARDVDVTRPWQGGKVLVDPRHSILEIKFNDRAPRWLGSLVSSLELQQFRFSKYCRAVDLEYFRGQLT